MPLKSRQTRLKQTKAEGVPATLRDVDLGEPTAASRHAAKKSSHLRTKEVPADRKVSPKRAPGTGRRTVPSRGAAAAKVIRRSEAGTGTKPGHHRKDKR